MRIYENKTSREMTPEEEAECKAVAAAEPPVPEPTAEERLAALEAAMLELVMGGTE